MSRPKPAEPVLDVVELVHGVVFAGSLQSSFTCEVFFMVVTDIRASHVLVSYASDALTDLLTLNAFHVSQHAFFCEVAFCQVVGRQRSSVVRRQSDQVVENTSLSRTVALEGADASIGFFTQFAAIIISAHQTVAVVSRNVLTFSNPIVEHLLTEVQSPVEGRAVVVNQLGVGHNFADTVNHRSDLTNVRLLGFDPQQVGTVLQAGDTVQNHTVFASAFFELEQARSQTLRLEQFALSLDYNVAVCDVVCRLDVFAIQEA